MRAVDENAFDNGFGVNESQQLNNLDNQSGIGIGGGSGVGISYGGGGGGSSAGFIPIVDTPNVANTDNKNILYIKSNTEASIYVNDLPLYQTTSYGLSVSLSDLLTNGPKNITVQKEGYSSGEKFIIDIVQNPKYYVPYIALDINPYDSLVAYSTRGLPNYTSDTNNLYTYDPETYKSVYSTTPAYTFRIRKFVGDVLETSYNYDVDSQDKSIDFTLAQNEVIVNPTDPLVPKIKLNVAIDGPNNSVTFIKNKKELAGVESFNLTNGVSEIEDIADSEISYSIQTSNINSYRITKIVLSGEGIKTETLEATSALESISTLINFDRNLNISITSENFAIIQATVPIISFANPAQLVSQDFTQYNINSDAAVPIGLNLFGNTTKVTAYVRDKTYEFNVSGQSAIIIIPSKTFDVIGKYTIKLVPNNSDGDGDVIETALVAVDDIWVGVPDIRNIQYPSVLRGPDYVGTDVDFNISYDSVDTDYVKIYAGSSNSNFAQLPKNGTHKFNFKQLLINAGTNVSEDQDIINLQLILVPYNVSGRQTVTGKKELITIQFDKGDLTIPREVAISRIAEGFIAQFDKTIFADETSKYLTHLLHIGNGDNKVITTWTGDNDSLILKLYEPLETTVQPNQQVWISKLQADPIVETITISGVDTSYCAPLKGPNFLLDADNGTAFKIFDDLIASGSTTSNDILNKITSQNNIDTEKLNIQYASGSSYTFDQFVHFGSAAERLKNFYYKINILQEYQSKFLSLTQTSFPIGYLLTEDIGGAGTPEIEGDEILIGEQIDPILQLQFEVPQVIPAPYALIEANGLAEKISNLIKTFDGYEKFLFKSENDLAYPKVDYFNSTTSLTYRVLRPITNPLVVSWYDTALYDSEQFDKYNSYAMRNNLPAYITEDYDNADFILFLDMIGQHFDILWVYINGIKKSKNVEHKEELGVPDSLVSSMLNSMGWNEKRAFNSQLLWEYMFGTSQDGYQKYGRSLQDANYEVWRRILNNLPYLLKHKGTSRALKAVMACYGVPQSMLTIMEFGGPQDPTRGGVSKFTFDDRTAAIVLDSNSSVKVPWKQTKTGDYPNCIEFRILPASITSTQRLVSANEWNLDLIQTTGSFAKLELNFGGDVATSTYILEPFISASVSTFYFDTASNYPYAYGPDLKTGSLGFPISIENYSNVAINRYNYGGATSLYEVWLGTSNGTRLTTFVSMSILTDDTQWESGNYIEVGSSGYSGNLDEFRLWTVPLQRSKFENHTLFPDAINGNDFDSSTKDLVFRLDFEYPKDRVLDPYIKNVSIDTSYVGNIGFATASNFPSIPTYPYNYIPYDRTVTANVPSLGFNVSNKIRFEDQTLIGDLSYKTRATQKSFDRAPIDSNRLGLFFSPIKELNMDILKAFGDFNIDNYIGDFGDEYKSNYKQLDILRHYYFERLDNRDIYEYIRLIRYIDKSLFEVLSDLAPVRTNISKGLLIEPHYLERNKTRWDKPQSLRNDFETFIDTNKDVLLDAESIPKDAILDASEITNLFGDVSNNTGIVDANDVIQLEATNPSYNSNIDANDGVLLEGSAPFYDMEIQCPTGASFSGEADSFTFTEVGMDRDSLANAGYGLYATNGTGLVRSYDPLFGNYQETGSRKNIFLIKQQYTQKINTQTEGYPATPYGQVKYEKIAVTKYRYKVGILPFSTGSYGVPFFPSASGDLVEITPLKGYFPTHYIYKNNLGEGMKRSFWKGSVQNSTTTPDGLDPVEIFTTNPNILRVAKTGRGSGEPILEVD
jgi:hypothetical protein